MRAHRRILAQLMALLLALGSWPSAAWAWGEEGHEIVATAARDILFARDPSFQQRFYAILQPDILDFSYTYVDRGQTRHRSCTSDRIREASVWADCVRNSAQYRSTRPYHYDDVRYCTDIPPMPARTSYCPGGNCATAALTRYIAQLRNPASSARLKAEALVWIIHIVGDLHQPLHAVDNDDGGGNGITFTFIRQTATGETRRETKLHSFWDGDMVKFATRPTNWTAAQVPMATRIDLIHDLAVANQAVWLQNGPNLSNLSGLQPAAFDPWVQQSHVVAQKAYRTLTPAPQCDAGSTDASGTMTYVDTFGTPTQEQLASAAVRLADLLERVLL